MTLQSIYEQDKERLVTMWTGAPKAEIIKTAEQELDKVLYAFNDREDNPRVREAANAMIRTAKASMGLLDTAGVTRIYGRTDYTGGGAVKEKSDPKEGKLLKRFWVLLILGLVFAAPYIYITYKLLSQVSSEWQWYLLISTPVAAMVLLFIAGACMRRQEFTSHEKMHAEVLTDPMKVYHQILAVILVIDKVLEEIRNAEEIRERQQIREEAGNADPKELELLSQLLEDAYARKQTDDQAAETISQIRFYLHRKHIDVIDWQDPAGNFGNASEAGIPGTQLAVSSSSVRNCFDMIPAYEAGTIRPAFVSEGKLLRKGLASAGSVRQ